MEKISSLSVNETPILSVLIPSIPSRIEKFFIPLYKKIESQSKDKFVEILALFDNKYRSIGNKRQELVSIAQGEYILMLDDDDDLSEYCIDTLVSNISKSPFLDLYTFNQFAKINDGNLFTVNFHIDNKENEQCKQIDGKWIDIKRKPFHNMCWKTSIAKSEKFPDCSYGEDWNWAERLIPKVKTHCHIPKNLTYYFYNDKITEAEATFPK